MEFNKKLIDKAEKHFYRLYPFHEDKEAITKCNYNNANVIMIYATDWEYEEPDYIRSNEQLADYIKKNV